MNITEVQSPCILRHRKQTKTSASRVSLEKDNNNLKTSDDTIMQMTIISFEKGEKKVITVNDPDIDDEKEKLRQEEDEEQTDEEKKQLEDTDEQVPVCNLSFDSVPSTVTVTTATPAGPTTTTSTTTTSTTKTNSDETTDDHDLDEVTTGLASGGRTEQIEKFVRHVLEGGWRVISFHHLPDWLKDNDFLRHYHRPPMPSFKCCFKSIFRVHTETGNIWTHLLGFIAFCIVTVLFFCHPSSGYTWHEKAVFTAFFIGALLCLGLSCVFHTVFCHSPKVSKLFSKLDYSGISALIVGSFIPWLYFSFYCEHVARYAYIILICVLGAMAIVVSLWDKFSEPKFRPLRAGVFIAMGLSALIPGVHFFIRTGFPLAFEAGAIGWMALMGAMYIAGAVLYAVRVPERFFPGKCDIVFQSHQIFHVLVVAAAFIHYHGISNMAGYRYAIGECLNEE